MIVATSRIRVVAGDAEWLAAKYRERLGLADACDGCLGVEVLRSLERPDEFTVYMRWRTREAYERYRRGPEFRAAHATLREAAGALKVERLDGGAQLYELLS